MYSEQKESGSKDQLEESSEYKAVLTELTEKYTAKERQELVVNFYNVIFFRLTYFKDRALITI